jgi:hypothetical protein
VTARISIGIALWVFAIGALAFDLQSLMSTLAKVDRSRVEFEETRHLSVLAAPLVRRGTLDYVRPDRLEMHVIAPLPETIAIVGTRVRVTSSDAVREWDLAGRPAALAWVEAIRASLAGDAAALERTFSVELSGTDRDWRMTLTPRDARVGAALRRVVVTGRQASIANLEIVDAQGDRVTMSLALPKAASR